LQEQKDATSPIFLLLAGLAACSSSHSQMTNGAPGSNAASIFDSPNENRVNSNAKSSSSPQASPGNGQGSASATPDKKN
jgi:hypothetical protein